MEIEEVLLDFVWAELEIRFGGGRDDLGTR
jgi:hypothetical protein